MNGIFGILPAELAPLLIKLLQLRRVIVELARIGRTQERIVDDGDFLHTAHGALELESLSLDEMSLPATLYLFGEIIEPGRDISCRGIGLFRIAVNFRPQHAGNRGLLDHFPIVAAVQVAQEGADDAGILDQRSEVAARPVFTGAGFKDTVVEPCLDEIVFQCSLVLQVTLGFAARDLIERRLRDIEIAAVDDLAHLPVEEGQQQRADMGAVDVCVRHYDNLVIAQLVD